MHACMYIAILLSYINIILENLLQAHKVFGVSLSQHIAIYSYRPSYLYIANICNACTHTYTYMHAHKYTIITMLYCCIVCNNIMLCLYWCICVCTGKEEQLWPIVRLIINQMYTTHTRTHALTYTHTNTHTTHTQTTHTLHTQTLHTHTHTHFTHTNNTHTTHTNTTHTNTTHTNTTHTHTHTHTLHTHAYS